MIVAFDFASWYGVVVIILGGYLFWAAVFKQGHSHVRAIKRWIWPEPPEAPVIVLSRPGYTMSTVPLAERRLQKQALLIALGPTYQIENKEPMVTVTDVTTGVRRRDDDREHAFPYKAAALAPGEPSLVTGVSIPQDLLEGLTDQEHEGAFLFWVRFRAPGGVRWEVVYDPIANEHSSILLK